MRLVDYNGTDHGPGQLGFGPGLNVVVCRPGQRAKLIDELAASFPIPSGQFDPREAVITSQDLEWICPSALGASSQDPDAEKPVRGSDQIRSALAKLGGRELAAKDALIRAESDRELVLAELNRVEEEELFRSQSEEQRNERIHGLQSRIAQLEEQAAHQPSDLSEISGLLAQSEWVQPWEDLSSIEDLDAQLARLADVEQAVDSPDSQDARPGDGDSDGQGDEEPKSLARAVPQWLVSQLEADLAEAHQQLENLLVDMVGREPTSLEKRLETRAREQLVDAKAAWDELFATPQKTDEVPNSDTDQIQELTQVLRTVKELFGLEFEDARSARTHVREYLNACASRVDTTVLTEALGRVGVSVDEEQDPVEVAEALVAHCAQEVEAREQAARDLVRVRDELANLQTWDEPSRYSADQLRTFLEKAENRLAKARRTFRDESTAIETTRKMLIEELEQVAAVDAENQQTHSEQSAIGQKRSDDLNDVYQRLADAVEAVREVAGFELPLFIDAAFDHLDDHLLAPLLGALAQLGETHQILYFTQSPHVERWAQVGVDGQEGSLAQGGGTISVVRSE